MKPVVEKMGRKYIIIAGTAGAGSALLKAAAERERLEARFPLCFLQLESELRAEEEKLKTDLVENCGAEFVWRFDGRSVLQALWNMGVALESGLETDMNLFPLSQFTIEVSELFGLNPYEEPAGEGALLITETPEEVLKKLKEAGITAASVGYLTAGAARTALTAEGIRYLNKER